MRCYRSVLPLVIHFKKTPWLPWGRNFYPHTHPIPIPMGIFMGSPYPWQTCRHFLLNLYLLSWIAVGVRSSAARRARPSAAWHWHVIGRSAGVSEEPRHAAGSSAGGSTGGGSQQRLRAPGRVGRLRCRRSAGQCGRQRRTDTSRRRTAAGALNLDLFQFRFVSLIELEHQGKNSCTDRSSSFYLPNNTAVSTFASIHFRRAGQRGPTRTLTAALMSIKQWYGTKLCYHDKNIRYKT